MADSTTPASATKVCTKCGETKPLTSFGRDKSKKSGHSSACHRCENARKRAYIDADRAAHAARCKDWARRNRAKLREYQRQWVAENAERERERHRRAYAADPEKRREAVRRSYHRHGEERRAYTRRYYVENRDQQRASARERRLANLIHYRLMEREQGARARCARHGVAVEVVDYAAILRRDGYTCHICGGQISPQTPDRVEFDHIIPPQHGGTHSASNIAVAHIRCNKKKWNKLLPLT